MQTSLSETSSRKEDYAVGSRVPLKDGFGGALHSANISRYRFSGCV
jgi:hypothetical protein